MDFTEVVLKRRMVRNFSAEPVSEDIVKRLIDLTRHAPSAGFTQGQSFVVVRDAAMKKRIAALCGEEFYVERGFHPWISEAPVLFIPCTSEEAYHQRYREADKTNDDGSEIEWPVPYWHMDIGCAVMVLLLAVVNEGLAAGFAGAHDLQALRDLLGIPTQETPVGVIPVGYGAPDVPSPSLKRGRKPDESYAHTERW